MPDDNVAEVCQFLANELSQLEKKMIKISLKINSYKLLQDEHDHKFGLGSLPKGFGEMVSEGGH